MPAPPPPFTKREIEKIHYLGKSFTEQPSRVVTEAASGSTIESTRATDLTWISQDDESAWLYDKLWRLVADSWRVSRLEMIQYAVYRPGGFFNWHNDNSYDAAQGLIVPPTVRARTATIVVQLSDPSDYTGGELLIRTPNGVVEAPKQKGRMTAFSSFIYHRVTPVKTGIRKTLVAWALR